MSNVKYGKVNSLLNDITLGIQKHLNYELILVQYSDVHYFNGSLVFRPPFK